MSFLSLAFLAALPLAAAPILLHLFDRRRNVAIDWGAMQFLVEAATRRTRARRLQHWLLLVMRVVCVAALVLALARPLAQTHWLGPNDRQEVILVIDNSLSTQQRSQSRDHSGEKIVFDELLRRAEETITALQSGNAVRILVTSPYPAWATPASLRLNESSREDLVERLHGVRATQGTSDIPAALLKAVQSNLEDQRLVGRRVVLLTDGQRHDWHPGDSEAWTRFNTALHESSVPTTLQVIEANVSQPVAANLAVTRVRTNRAVVGVNHPLSITAEVCNFASGGAENCAVTWFIDQHKHSASSLTALAPGEKRDVTVVHSFAKPGAYVVTCQLDPGDQSADTLTADNAESIVICVVERVPVLLVENAKGYAELQQDAYLVRAALGQIEANESEVWRAVFEPRTIAPEQLDSIDLSDFQAVVIPNLTSLSAQAAERLREFVAGGGGLWLALGPRTDMEAFNALLFNAGDGLSPVGLARIVDESRDELLRTTINPFAASHPATSGLADNEHLDTGDVAIQRRFRFQMPLAREQVSVLLNLSNGDPLAVENRLGRGRVIVLGVPLRHQWSSLSVSQALVVMVHNWLSYLTEPGTTQHNLLPGDSISLQVAASEGTHAVLTTPSSEDIAVSGEPLPRGVLFQTSRTAAPGKYALDLGLAGGKIPFHVARDAVESELSVLTAADRTFLSQAGALTRGRAVTHSTGAVPRSAIWPGLLVLLVAFIAGELILSGAIARQRFGTEPISETAEELASQESMFVGVTVASPRRQPAVGITNVDSRDRAVN